MCGIIAYLGSDSAADRVLQGLSLLQNRGYDSAGIGTLSSDSSLVLHKFASRTDRTSIELLEEHKHSHAGHTIGIGHTRWATHGAKTDDNAHPHVDSKRQFAVVHNGIIENYFELKQKLVKEGYVFDSQTDTEVIPKLLEFYWEKEQKRCMEHNTEHDIENNVIKRAISDLEGTWALCILCTLEPDVLYLCKNGSPLVLSYHETCIMVASESLPLSIYFNQFIALQDHDIIRIHKKEGMIQFHPRREHTMRVIENKVSEISCAPYPFWTIKEIYEQPESLLRTLNMGGRLVGEDHVKLGGLDAKRDRLLQIDHLLLLGCGTSYHAGQIGATIIKGFKCFHSVQCIDASEWSEADLPLHGSVGVVLLSQSGETKDVHQCLPLLRAKDYIILSIVNVVGSLLARESDCGIYLNAGREVGVASTKSFTSQIVALTLLGLWFSQNRGSHQTLRTHYIRHLRSLSMDVEAAIHSLSGPMERLARSIQNVEHLFILGRGAMKFIADEGALKIKEIAYIHAEGYAGGALKHGPFALIDSNTVIILLAPQDEHFVKMIHAASEIHSRRARIILITNSTNDTSYSRALFEEIIVVPNNPYFQTVLSILPLQLLAYELAICKGYDPDFPRNLAKVVTVL